MVSELDFGSIPEPCFGQFLDQILARFWLKTDTFRSSNLSHSESEPLQIPCKLRTRSELSSRNIFGRTRAVQLEPTSGFAHQYGQGFAMAFHELRVRGCSSTSGLTAPQAVARLETMACAQFNLSI